MSERIELPNRRSNYTVTIRFITNSGDAQKLYVTFGVDGLGRVREVFGNASKTGTDIQALISDAAIACSHLLQRGMSITEIAESFGENRQEGTPSGPPSSPLGAIARAGCEIEAMG